MEAAEEEADAVVEEAEGEEDVVGSLSRRRDRLLADV